LDRMNSGGLDFAAAVVGARFATERASLAARRRIRRRLAL